MKIVIDNVVFTIQKIGGISVVWYEIIKRLLLENSLTIQFIECENANENFYRRMLSIPSDCLQIIKKRWFRLNRYINPTLGYTAPYIFHSTYYRISRDKSAINFTTVHDFVYERSGKKDIATKVHIWQQKQAVKRSDVVICISENTKRDLLFYYKDIDASKIHVVYNGVSDDYYRLLDWDKSILPFGYKSYCIYIGVRRAYKNFNLAVESLAKTSYKLLIIGSPLSVKEQDYLNCQLGEDRYLCMSNVSNEDLNKFYNGAFALLYLSIYEGFGIPCLEAQKAGCPIVALNKSSILEVVCDKRLLVNDPNIENVLAKICDLRDSNYYDSIVEKGCRFASEFTWDKTYSHLRQLYEQAYHERTKG